MPTFLLSSVEDDQLIVEIDVLPCKEAVAKLLMTAKSKQADFG
jgi:hypothetical protein